ncbi:MAG: cytochrome b [Xanthobacteraceae bacterium]
MKALFVSRYHPLLVMLHWLIAVLIIALLSIGFFLAVAVPNTDPHKISILLIHMAAGMFVFALMAVRFIVRLSTARPSDAAARQPASAGSRRPSITASIFWCWGWPAPAFRPRSSPDLTEACFRDLASRCR